MPPPLAGRIALVQHPAYALGGRVVVIGGVDGQELRHDFGPVGEGAVNVGEGPAPVDGEMELAVAVDDASLFTGRGGRRGRLHSDRADA